jgi:hypothetical protein
MATNKKQAGNDVAKPGTTTANATSRPVVVSHKPMIKDPMVSNSGSNEPKATVSNTGKLIKPPSETEPTEAAAQATPTEATVVASDTTAVTETADEPEIEPADETEVASDAKAEVDAVLDQAADKNKDRLAEEQAAEHAKNLEHLIESKKFFVPIGDTPRRHRLKLLLWLILLGILALGILWYMIDANIIDFGIKLPFDLF